MKKITTILLSAAMLLAGTSLFAQNLSVGAGWINSTLTGKNGDNKIDPETSNGFYVGASYNIPLVAGLGVAPGLYYSMLGGKVENSAFGGLATGKSTFTEHAINVPVNFNYGFDLRDVKFFVFAGPTLQYGLASKYKYDLNVLGSTSTAEVDNYKDADRGRFNVYLGGGAGANIAEAFQVTIGFDYGLLNLYKGNNTNLSYHRYNIKIGVAYLF